MVIVIRLKYGALITKVKGAICMKYGASKFFSLSRNTFKKEYLKHKGQSKNWLNIWGFKHKGQSGLHLKYGASGTKVIRNTLKIYGC